MKNLFLVIMFLFLFVSVCFGADSINCYQLGSSGYELAASSSLTFNVSRGSEGFFVVQPTFTGTGTLKIEYQTSTLGNNWTPAVQITASATSATMYPYPASGTNIFAGKQRLIFTETGGANSITFTEIGRCAQ